MRQQPFHQPLAIIEVAPHCQVQHIGGTGRGHLQSLHRRHPPQRMQHDQVDAVQAGEGPDRGCARIAAGRGHQQQPLAPAGQGGLRQHRHHLHGVVLEGGRGTVKQLQNKQARCQLDERRGLRVLELAGHPGRRPLQNVRRQGGPHKGCQDRCRQRCTPAVHRRGPPQVRPGRRHIETAIGGHAGQQGGGEINVRRGPARTDVGGEGRRSHQHSNRPCVAIDI